LNKINCIIVDDEPIARDIIINYCGHIPLLEIVASCENAFEAKESLQQKTVQLMLLDINMPLLDGISFVKTLKNPPQTIFTTAYKEHAIMAFDLAACDYLVKPFSLERFIIAIDKAVERIGQSLAPQQQKADCLFLSIKTEGRIYRIMHDELLYVEASGNYTKLITISSVLVPNISFSSFEKLLPSNQFIRIHRSFIVNKSKFSYIQGGHLLIGKHEIPIGKNYKDNFLKTLGL
jgi:DNA-binding LytR/AlgR family response regulator